MRIHRIASIPADGIGPEVIEAGLEVLDALAARMGDFRLDITRLDWGSDRYKSTLGDNMTSGSTTLVLLIDGLPVQTLKDMFEAGKLPRLLHGYYAGLGHACSFEPLGTGIVGRGGGVVHTA